MGGLLISICIRRFLSLLIEDSCRSYDRVLQRSLFATLFSLNIESDIYNYIVILFHFLLLADWKIFLARIRTFFGRLGVLLTLFCVNASTVLYIISDNFHSRENAFRYNIPSSLALPGI